MPILNRTSLTSSDKLNLLAKTVGYHPHGAISSLADEYALSRKTIYQTRDAAIQAIGALVGETNEPDVITTVGVDTEQLRRTIVALACTAPTYQGD